MYKNANPQLIKGNSFVNFIRSSKGNNQYVIELYL